VELAQPIIQLHPVLHDGYEWGWSFWVALGTLTLAAATGWLAWKTREVAAATGTVALETKQLAKETTELAKRTSEDVAAQFRPVLIPSDRVDLTGRVRPLSVLDDGTVHCDVLNDGRGPALDVSASILPANIVWRSRQSATVAAGSTVLLTFKNVDLPADELLISIKCRDLSENLHTSNFNVRRVDGEYVIVGSEIRLDSQTEGVGHAD
jgi:hypothetical protein